MDDPQRWVALLFLNRPLTRAEETAVRALHLSPDELVAAVARALDDEGEFPEPVGDRGLFLEKTLFGFALIDRREGRNDRTKFKTALDAARAFLALRPARGGSARDTRARDTSTRDKPARD